MRIKRTMRSLGGLYPPKPGYLRLTFAIWVEWGRFFGVFASAVPGRQDDGVVEMDAVEPHSHIESLPRKNRWGQWRRHRVPFRILFKGGWPASAAGVTRGP